MKIEYGKGTTDDGPGVSIYLDEGEVTRAIWAWLVAHGVHVEGARTTTINGEFPEIGHIYLCRPLWICDR